MCRMLAYLGRPLRLGSLLEDPPHSLERQSYQARELDGATVNADGWGFGWYSHESPEAFVYRSTLPIWADVNRSHLCRAIRSPLILAAVRSATDPLGVTPANTQPFLSKGLLFVHNGYIENFASSMKRKLASMLSDEKYAAIGGNTDSEHVFALLSEHYDRLESTPRSERLRLAAESAFDQITTLAQAAGTRALLTFVVSDGRELVLGRLSAGAKPPTLYVSSRRDAEIDGWLVASEPLDELNDWTAVAPGSILTLDAERKPQERVLA